VRDGRTIAAAVILLSAGTYLFRWAGPALPERLVGSAYAKDFINTAAMLLLVGVMAASAITENREFAGWARPLAVALAGLLAWRRAPFIVVIIAAAAAAATFRMMGVS
jgi:branched-subunit amino acid transport protein